MNTRKDPFAERSYRLSSCEVRRLEQRNVDPISQTLASMDPWLSLGYSSTGLSGYLQGSDSGLYRYSAEVAGECAGVVCVRHPWLRGPFLEVLAVFHPYQSQGIGHDIILWMEDEVRGLSKNIWTTVSSFNTKGLSFYRKLAYVEIAVLPDLVSMGFGEILMRKVL